MSADKNRLVTEKSPYLLQHADNPVDWYPWCEEAFEKAEEEDKPVFVSIGYATCHWCHVMAHESFEDERIAGMMNDAFVSIKVDREERPDIDNTYMTVCQMLTGSGGWPLTIIMTPEKKPFYAGTYIPKRGRSGRPGMYELIPRINELWEQEQDKIHDSSEEIAQAFRQSINIEKGEQLTDELFEKTFNRFWDTFDETHGGFGNAPKFPAAHNLLFLLRYWKQYDKDEALSMVKKSLTCMRRGGMYDQLGFGFHRYSTDSKWLVPHFEKMLYDQAMLMMAYTEAWQATGDPLFKKTTGEIIDYLLRDLHHDNGGFYSAEDADSEGEEGKFYVWSIKEVREILPQAEAELAIEVFNMTEEGNYADEATGRKTGKNILHFNRSPEELAEERGMSAEQLVSLLKEIRQTLFEAREKRTRPFLDDKILTDWNGLIIAALAKAGRTFNNKEYLTEAERTLQFIRNNLVSGENRLLHRYRDGEAAIKAHADDYAFLIWGLRELYESTFDLSYLQRAIALQEIFLKNFWDEEDGGFYFSSSQSEQLLGRKKEGYDGALPSSNSVALMNLAKLGRITANTEWEQKAESIGQLYSSQLNKAPTGFSQMVQALLFQLGSSYEITLAGRKDDDRLHQMKQKIWELYVPNKITVFNEAGNSDINNLAPYTENQPMIEDKPTAYICRDYACRQPVTEVEEIAAQLQE